MSLSTTIPGPNQVLLSQIITLVIEQVSASTLRSSMHTSTRSQTPHSTPSELLKS